MKRSFFENLATFLGDHVCFGCQITPFRSEYAGLTFSVSIKSVVSQFVAFGRSYLSDNACLLLADQREPVFSYYLPGRHGRADDLDVLRMPYEPDDFGVFVAGRAEHAFHVRIDEPAGQVEQDG